MDTFDPRKLYRRARRTSKISIRIEPETYNFLKRKNLSPTRVFDAAMMKIRRRKW